LLGLTRLGECVGRRFAYSDAVAIPLPHPSGASGWLNEPANRALVAEAAALVREELDRLGGTASPSPPSFSTQSRHRHVNRSPIR